MKNLIYPSLNSCIVSAKFSGTTRIVAIITMDNFTSLTFDAVHISFALCNFRSCIITYFSYCARRVTNQ